LSLLRLRCCCASIELFILTRFSPVTSFPQSSDHAGNKMAFGLNVFRRPDDDDDEHDDNVDKSKYAVPFWSPSSEAMSAMTHAWRLDVIRDGVELPPIGIAERAVWVIGRQPTCDIVLEHGSLSREHAVLQFRSNGSLYVFDLASTHGTFLNKQRLDPHTYVPLKNGDFLRFGASTRQYVVQGGPEVQPAARLRVARDAVAAAAEAAPVAADADGAVFTGNAQDFKAYVTAQRALAQSSKKGKKLANVLSARDAGFDSADMRGNRAHSDRDKERLDFNEKRTFTTSSRDKRAVMGSTADAADDAADDDIPRDGSDDDDDDDDDDGNNQGEDETGGDALAARRHFGLEHETNDTFDDDDDFYDRAKPVAPTTAAATATAQAALGYEDLAARRDGLALERGRVRDELQWYAANVIDADEFALSNAAAADALDQFEIQQAAAEHKAVAKRLEQLDADIADAHAATIKLARIAVPPGSAAAQIDAHVRAEALWLRDAVVRQFMARLDQLCAGIKRSRPQRPVAQSRARAALASKPAALTADEIAKEERALWDAQQRRKEDERLAEDAQRQRRAAEQEEQLRAQRAAQAALAAKGSTAASATEAPQTAKFSAGLNSSVKRPVKGPRLENDAPNLDAVDAAAAADDDDDDERVAPKKRRTASQQQPQPMYDSDVPVWTAPSNQDGSGRTALNDKLGY